MKYRGIPIVVSGFSGAGKGTLMKRLLELYPDSYALSVSATTRQKREGEQEGVNYFYVTRDRFEEMIRNGELYEHTEYQGNYYGTPKHYVDEHLENGVDVILEIEVEGAMNIRRIFPNAPLIFVTAPSAEELRSRLTGRQSETAEQIAGRLKRACQEAAFMKDYDYLVINDEIDRAVEELHNLIKAAHRRVSENTAYLAEITEELQQLK
ncbi:MAG: guanylate kinase [Lachnospiraceae bacterium]|nr:guanylate kinase [Lachnospiraceae bacterium]